MTDRPEYHQEREDTDTERTTIIVPGTAGEGEESTADIVASERQQARDLGSASRSCVAIIAVLLIMALLICVFLTWATFFQ